MSSKMNMLAVLPLASVLLLASGCAPGGGQAVDDGQSTTVVTDPSQMGDVTLHLTDFWHDAEGDWMQASIDAFEEKYPNITVDRTVQDWVQIMDTNPLRLAEDDSPDLITVNNGWQSMGTLAQGGLIVNLDPYAKAYGWDDVIPSTIQRQLKFSLDGTKMGEGSLWAAPSARVQNIGIYVNKAILEQLGLEMPASLEDFEAAAAAAASAGITPIAYGETDKPIAPLFALQAVLGDRDAIADVVYGSGTLTVADTGMGEAAARVKEWADKGWLMANYEGLSSADANAKFLEGGALFDFYYSGLVPGDQPNRADFGYLQLPQASGSMVAVGAPADNLAISAKSKNKDAAALLLDFLMSQDAAQITADFGYMPLLQEVTIPQDDPLIAEEAAAAQLTEADNGYVPYFDWTTATMLDTVGTQMQLVLAARSTPDDLVAAAQADIEAFKANR